MYIAEGALAKKANTKQLISNFTEKQWTIGLTMIKDYAEFMKLHLMLLNKR